MAGLSKLDIIEQYIGKDVWVYCQCNSRYIDNGPIYKYIRFLDFYNYGVDVIVNAVGAVALERGDVSLYDTLREMRYYTSEILQISTKVFTTEELFGRVDNYDNANFQSLASRGYWVLAYNHSHPQYENIEYVRIRDIDGRYVTYDFINCDMVDYVHGSTDADWEGVPPSEQVETAHTYLNAFELYTPIEVFTDEEMQEALAIADIRQQEAFAAEVDDEDE